MKGFIGKNGHFYSDAQRKAIFAGVKEDSLSGMLIKVADPGVRKIRNEFVLPALAAGASLAAGGAAETLGTVGAGASLAGAGFIGAPEVIGAGVAGSGLMGGIGEAFRKGAQEEGASAAKGVIHGQLKRAGSAVTAPIVKPLEFGAYELGQVKQTAEAAAKPGAMLFGALIGSSVGELGGLGAPYAETSGELIEEGHRTGLDPWGNPVLSRMPENVYSGSAWSIDVDKMRELVKKQYPDADVDTDVVMLPPDKYMRVALDENPGRESEAVMSNGFYSPTQDKTYLEADDRLNTTRALIHELAHDMSDDGVEDPMLNEGYADYIAKKIMVQELKIPEPVVKKTIGYPKEEREVEDLVKVYGRKNVDRAFLKYHTLDYLNGKERRKSALLTANT
jgi:hypothetical protein